MIASSFHSRLSSSEKDLNGASNSGLCDAGVMLYISWAISSARNEMITFIYFHSPFQIQFVVLSSAISTSTGLYTTHITTCTQLPDNWTTGALRRHRRGRGTNPRSGLNFQSSSSAKNAMITFIHFYSAFQIQILVLSSHSVCCTNFIPFIVSANKLLTSVISVSTHNGGASRYHKEVCIYI